jgi:hypothetical protein
MLDVTDSRVQAMAQQAIRDIRRKLEKDRQMRLTYTLRSCQED